MAAKPPVEDKKEYSRKPIYYSMIVVIIVLLLVGLYLNNSSKPPNVDPISTIRAYVDYINEQEAESALDMTVNKFGYDYMKNYTLQDLRYFGDTFLLEMKYIQVFTEDEMAPDYLREWANLTEDLEYDFKVTIQEVSYINFTRTYHYYGGESVDQGYTNMGCVKVDGYWYICNFNYHGQE